MARAPVPVFVNAAAGLERVDLDLLRDALGSRASIELIDPAQLRDRVAAAAAGGHGIVGVAGGDGTLRTAAGALVRTATALLCIPTGTLNNFARRLGITDIASAVAALDAGAVDSIATGTIDGDIFLNTVTFGEYPRIVRIRERLRRWIAKWPAALVAFIIALFTLRRITLVLEADGRELTRRTPFLWVGLGWGSFPRVHEAIERRSTPDLEIAVLKSSTRGAALGFVLRLGWSMATGRGPLRDPELEVVHARELRLQRGVRPVHRLDATADGEVLRLPGVVKVGVRDDALLVIVNRNTMGAVGWSRS